MMTSWFLPLVSILVGLVLLVWSADRFITGAAATARSVGMSPLLIGITIVSLGTSAPEMLVSVMASFSNASHLAVGNVLGSNIANIGLVLGITALISPLPIKSTILRKELPLLFLITLLAGFCLWNLFLGHWDGLLLLIGLIATLFFLFWQGPKTKDKALEIEEAEEIPILPIKKAIFWLVIGLVLLILSSRLLVYGAVEIAQLMGISELVIGLTIIAIGTSLPELAASIASALKNHHDIALGNVIGSNIFNLATVLPLPGLIQPIGLGAEVFWRDYVIMLSITVVLIGFIYLMRQKACISRLQGAIFVGAYLSYLVLLYAMTAN